MAKILERPLDNHTLALVKSSSREALKLLGVADKIESPADVVDAIDACVVSWQRQQRAPIPSLTPADGPRLLGSLWGDQLVKRFAWLWVMIAPADGVTPAMPAVVPPDRSLAVFPVQFVAFCIQNPKADCTIALAFKLIEQRKIGKLKPRQYLRLMDGVKRVAPRA